MQKATLIILPVRLKLEYCCWKSVARIVSTSFKLSRRSSSLPDFASLTALDGVSGPAVSGAEADGPGIFGDDASENESNRTSPGLPLGFETVSFNGITGKQTVTLSIVDMRGWMKAK